MAGGHYGCSSASDRYEQEGQHSFAEAGGGGAVETSRRGAFICVIVLRWEENQVQGSKWEVKLELGSRPFTLALDLCFLNYVRLVHGTRVSADPCRHGLESCWDTAL